MVTIPNNKPKLLHNCKSLSGGDIILKIFKQGKTLNVVLEQNVTSFLWTKKFLVALMVFAFALIYVLFSNNVAICFTAIFLLLFLYLFLGIVQEESVVMVKSLGFQITTKYLIGEKNLFIPCDQVQTVFINEVILRHKVIYLLMIFAKDDSNERLIPLFLNIKPRLRCLEIIYKHLKEVKS